MPTSERLDEQTESCTSTAVRGATKWKLSGRLCRGWRRRRPTRPTTPLDTYRVWTGGKEAVREEGEKFRNLLRGKTHGRRVGDAPLVASWTKRPIPCAGGLKT
jgi:hypothetical protein